MVEVILQSRYDWIEQAVNDCADGKLPLNDLCQKVAAAGFRTTCLYEMVRAAEQRERTVHPNQPCGYDE